MLKSQKGFSQVLVLLLLLLTIPIGLFLVQHPAIFNPKAADNTSTPASALVDKQIWLVPNSFSLTDRSHRTNPVDYQSFWNDETKLQNVLSKTSVFGVFSESEGVSDANLQKAIPILKKYNIKISMEIAGVNGRNTDICNNHTPGEIGAQVVLEAVKKLYDAGLKVDYLVMDDPIARLVQYSDYGGVCNYNIADTVTEIVDSMKAIHAAYPDIKIGLDYNFPNRRYGGIGPYWGPSWPNYNIVDYKDVTDALFAKVQLAGEHIDFINVDSPYDFSTGIAPIPYTDFDPKSVDWIKRIVDLEKQVKSYGARFGLIVNSGRGMDQSNSLFKSDSLAYLDAYKAKGGSPDNFVLESWGNYPNQLLPDSETNTFMNTAAEVIKKTNTFLPSTPPATPTPTPNGWDYNLTHRCVKTVDSTKDNYYQDLTDCPTPGKNWTIAVESEKALQGSCPGPVSQSFKINDPSSPVKLSWTPHTDEQGRANQTVKLTTDLNNFTHPCGGGYFTWTAFMDHGYLGGGPFPKPQDLKFSTVINYDETVRNGATRAIINFQGVWDSGKGKPTAHEIEINLSLNNWGDGHPDADIIKIFRNRDSYGSDDVIMDGSKLGNFVRINGAPITSNIAQKTDLKVDVDFPALINNLTSRNDPETPGKKIMDPPINGWDNATTTELGVATEVRSDTASGGPIATLAVNNFRAESRSNPSPTSKPSPSPTPKPTPTPIASILTGKITGPTSLKKKKSGSYTATITSTKNKLTKIEIYVDNPAGTQNWSLIGKGTCSKTTCSLTQKWTPSATGTYTLMINGYDANHQNCTGNPYLNNKSDPTQKYCGSSSSIKVNVTK